MLDGQQAAVDFRSDAVMQLKQLDRVAAKAFQTSVQTSLDCTWNIVQFIGLNPDFG